MDVLRHRAGSTPDRVLYTFLRDSGEDLLSYGELDRRARQIAARLQESDLRGERVLLLFEPGIDFAASFLGCLAAGAVAVPTYLPGARRAHWERLARIATDAGARAALTTGQLQDQLAGEWGLLRGCQPVAIDRLPEGLEASWRAPDLSRSDLAFLQYTSGSTGDPKGVMVSHGNLMCNEELIRTAACSYENPAIVSWLPLYHDMGLIGNLLQALYTDAPAHLLSPVAFLQKPLRWLEAITRARATLSGAPNFAYELCLERVTEEQKARLDLSSWRVAFNGAEPVRTETLERFSSAFASCGFRRSAFHPCFGLAESTLMVTFGPIPAEGAFPAVERQALQEHRVVPVGTDDPRAQHLAPSGPPAGDTVVRIVDPATRQVCAAGAVGEIWVQGGSVAQGYWERPEATDATFRAATADGEGPFLRTGDLGFLHQGQLCVTGRLKETIIVNGRNYYPQDVERCAQDSCSVLRAGAGAAFAIEEGGEERVVLVQEVERTQLRRFDAGAALATIRQAVSETLDLQLHDVVFIKPAQLPKTSSGKIQRRLCRERYLRSDWERVASAAPAAAPAAPPAGPVQATPAVDASAAALVLEQRILPLVAARLGLTPEQLDVSRAFSSYGLDSKTAVSLSGELSELLGRALPATLLYDRPNLRALVLHLAGEEPAAAPLPLARPSGGDDRVAVIGLGCRFPGADGPERFWQLLHEAREGIGPVPAGRWDAEALYDPRPGTQGKMCTREGGFLDGVDRFDADFFGIAPREARDIDPQQRLLLETSWQALEHASIVPARLRGGRTGVFVGISSNDYLRLQLQQGTQATLYTSTGNAFSIAANRLSYLLDLRGPSVSVDTACSSSLVALHQACLSLRQGDCSLALAAGVNLILSPDITVAFSAAGMLSPEGRCKTFSSAANGYVRSEGCGVVVLKRLADAERDGDRVLAVIRGSAVNQDGASNGLTAPNGPAQEAVIRDALASAGLGPEALDYVEAHGTATPLGDPIEVTALDHVFRAGNRQERLRIGSVKSNLGHLEAGAGIAGFIKVVLALQHQEIPASLHCAVPTSQIDWERVSVQVATRALPWSSAGGRTRRAGVSSFGFGGTNAHVIVEEAPAAPPAAAEAAAPGDCFVLPLSAHGEPALRAQAGQYLHLLKSPDAPAPEALCAAAGLHRTHFGHRLAVVGRSAQELRTALAGHLAGQPEGLAFSGQAPQRAPRIAFIFGGFGSQYPGMCRSLYQASPLFRETLDRCDQILRRHLPLPLLDVLFSPQGEAALEKMVYAKPALVAVQYALALLWRSLGALPHTVIGHSTGEYAAACFASVFSLEDGLMLACERARLMESLPEGGAMCAVLAGEEQVAELLAASGGELVIANYNGPEQLVLSGRRSAVERAIATLTARGIEARDLGIHVAAHSPFMEPILAGFHAVASRVAMRPPALRFVSNLDGRIAGAEMATADYWTRHLREQVRFSQGMSVVQQDGCEVFLGIEPRASLLGSAQQCLPAGAGLFLPSLRRSVEDRLQVARNLAGLYAAGVPVEWAALFGPGRRAPVPLPTYPFQGRRHWFQAGARSTSAGRGPAAGLAGSRLVSASSELQFEAHLSAQRPGYLADHRVLDQPVFPAAGYLGSALAAAACATRGPLRVEGLELPAALLLGEEERRVHTVVAPLGDGRLAVRTSALEEDRLPGGSWTLHAACTVAPAGALPEAPPLAALRARCTEVVDVAAFYQRCEGLGIGYGPAFRSIRALLKGDGEALGRVCLGDELSAEGGQLHPALLDGCLQVTAAALAEGPGRLLLPVAIEAFQLEDPSVRELWSHARVRPESQGLLADLALFAPDGRALGAITGLRLAPAAPGRQRLEQQSLYQASWAVRSRPAPAAVGPGTFLLVGEECAEREELAWALEQAGQRCLQLLPSALAAELARLRPRPEGLRGVVLLSRPAAAPVEGLDAAVVQRLALDALESSRAAVLALARAGLAAPLRFWSVTRGACTVRGGDGPALTDAPLSGLLRVVALEHPELRARCIDLDPWDRDLSPLVAELLGDDREDEVAFRGGVRYVARLARARLQGPGDAGQLALPGHGPVRLALAEKGQLEGLHLITQGRRPPGEGEVELRVRAAGLNFMDVLDALGLYPDPRPGDLGGECAGEVVAVGPGVPGLQVGDRVMGIALGAFGDYATTRAELLAPLPAHLSFAQGATIPVAYLTAWDALLAEGPVQRGERVLVHAAAGGVGLAAVHLLRAHGATVCATASPSKWDYLRSIGLQEVMSSRTLEFAAQLAAPEKQVDRVVNCLAGDFIPKSLSVLRHGGRFIELGKRARDEWGRAQVERVRPDVGYRAVDLFSTCLTAPETLAPALRQIAALVAARTLPPLPLRAHPLRDAVAAFRSLQEARQVGKVVLTLPADAEAQAPIRGDATYLVTGGLQGLGLATARWLVAHGARHLALVARSRPTPAAEALLGQLAAQGVSVRTFQADVADAEALRGCLAAVGATMPALAGVFHAAGVLANGLLADLDRARFHQVLAPKVAGAWNLHLLTRDLPLDLFVLYSSAAGVLGGPGQANYAAANTFLDALAHHRRALCLPALSVDWGAFSDTGLVSTAAAGRQLEAQGIGTLTSEAGLQLLWRLLASPRLAQVAVLPIDWHRFAAGLGGSVASPFSDLVTQAARSEGAAPAAADTGPAAGEDLLARLSSLTPQARDAQLAAFVAARVARTLGFEPGELDQSAPLLSLGLDSLMAVNLKGQIKTRLGVDVPVVRFMKGMSSRDLAAFLGESLACRPAEEPAAAAGAEERQELQL